MPWGLYGRTDELRITVEIIGRNRWFFVKMTGRRRIGKTTLIQHAIQTAGGKPIFYVQTPDSAPAGVLSAVDDALESFNVSDPTGLQVLKCRVSGRRHFCHPSSYQGRGCENGRSTEDPASES